MVIEPEDTLLIESVIASHRLVHSLNPQILDTYCVQVPFSKTDQNSCPHGVYILADEDVKQTGKQDNPKCVDCDVLGRK